MPTNIGIAWDANKDLHRAGCQYSLASHEMPTNISITRGANNKLYGDVEFEAAKARAGWITPVPGGVGPMTRVALLQNTMQAAASHLGITWAAL